MIILNDPLPATQNFETIQMYCAIKKPSGLKKCCNLSSQNKSQKYMTWTIKQAFTCRSENSSLPTSSVFVLHSDKNHFCDMFLL